MQAYLFTTGQANTVPPEKGKYLSSSFRCRYTEGSKEVRGELGPKFARTNLCRSSETRTTATGTFPCPVEEHNDLR